MISLLSSLYRYLAPLIPPGFVACFASAFIEDGAYLKAYIHEYVGTLLMILLTFTPGKWIGEGSREVEWAAHAAGIVAADYVGGGPHVNPGVTAAFFALGKLSYTEAFVRVMGAMAGGLVAFPLFKAFTDVMGWKPLGGPEFDPQDNEEGLVGGSAEFWTMLLLMGMIYVLNFELDFGKYHYWIKQLLTAIGIRFLIEAFPVSGGIAINPMLGTTWYIFAHGGFPDHLGHYFEFWVASFAGGIMASFLYVVYAGGKFFGRTLPIGPMKEEVKAESKKKD